MQNSEEVIIQLFKSKCLPILLYCTEACKCVKLILTPLTSM